jgi:signal transduction histidine kinase
MENANLSKEFNEIVRLTADNPKLLLSFLKMKRSHEDAARELASLAADVKADPRSLSPADTQEFKVVQERFKKLAIRMGDFRNEVEALESSPEVRLIEQVIEFLFIGIALNMAIAVAIAIGFSKSISARLAYLSENARRLAANAVMNRPLVGSDEVSELDLVLHKVADDMSSARARRKELLELVNRRLQLPLSKSEQILSRLCLEYKETVPESVCSRLKTADANMLRLISLLDDLVGLDNLKTAGINLNKTRVGISEVVREAVSGVQAYADKKHLHISTPVDDCSVFADKHRLVQVLINFLSNAIKFSPEGSKISIELALVSPATVEISVIDQGSGILPELQQKIFEPFEQSNREDATQRGGSGLGLSICKTIMEAHGGKVGVDSKPGEGSRFWLRLPSDEKAGQSTRLTT